MSYDEYGQATRDLIAFVRARLDEQFPSDSTSADRMLLDAHEQAGNIAQDDQYDSGFIAGIDHAIRCRALAWHQHPGYRPQWAP